MDFDSIPLDIVFQEYPNENNINTKMYHNNTMVLINGINRSRNYSQIWEELKNKEDVTVSIDTFHCGVLFFRKEQAKEHFKIRI